MNKEKQIFLSGQITILRSGFYETLIELSPLNNSWQMMSCGVSCIINQNLTSIIKVTLLRYTF